MYLEQQLWITYLNLLIILWSCFDWLLFLLLAWKKGLFFLRCNQDWVKSSMLWTRNCLFWYPCLHCDLQKLIICLQVVLESTKKLDPYYACYLHGVPANNYLLFSARFNNHYPPASEASRGVYWNQGQKNFTHPYTEYCRYPSIGLQPNGNRSCYTST